MLLIVAGLAGEATLAAEMAVVQGALLATFYAFSANARSLILQGHDALTAGGLLAKRALALPLLAAAGYLLCVHAAGVAAPLALLLILRRACEWLAEVRLCEIEVASDRRAARRAFASQAVITAATAALLLSPKTRLPALAIFAISPLFAALPRFRAVEFRPAALLATLRGASPHIGSTAIEGISTYVLRLVVFLVAAREMAGLLFTAFALGSFVASLFANILGPSLALQRARDAQPRLQRAVWLVALALAAVGGALLAASRQDWGSKPSWFWLALGLSFLGAALMIVAQTIRLRFFDERQAEVLFGPDVLRNLTAIVAAPALYFLVAPPALGALYLVTALLTLVFYWSAWQGELLAGWPWAAAALQVALAAALLFPLFFVLSGRVYHVEAPLLDSAGTLKSVPLPLSLLVCFAGIMLLARYGRATAALGTIFFLFTGMVFTSAAISQGDVASESRKFVLLFQFLLPAFALVLGQMFAALRQAAIAFAIVLAVLVPAQLLRSLGHPGEELRHDLWLFSVYQHLQYVPPVVVCAWLVATFALWEERRPRWLLVALAPLVALYASRSYATLAIALVVGSGLLVFLARPRERAAQLCVLLVLAAVAGFLYANREAYPLLAKFDTSDEDTSHRLKQAPSVEVSRDMIEAVPGPMQARLAYWTLYARGIGESPRAALLGHPRAIERSVAPSAHNYYLDFVYNFGVLAFAPLAWLISYTTLHLWRQRRRLRASPVLGLAAAVVFALFIDSMFKVPLRQPYAGIFFFFLWGLLLAQLQPARR